jgi:serine protease AprX
VTTALQRELVGAGITMVWANGNAGGDGSSNVSSNDGTAQIPGVVSVANYDDGDTGTRDGELDDSSSRGDADDPASWPDLSAPGTAITSACRPYLTICATGLEVDPNYGTIGGTSMASPHVAGAVAILQQAALALTGAPLTPAEVEDLLEDTAHEFGEGYETDPNNDDSDSSFDKGHGLLDLVAALDELSGSESAEPGPVTVA